MQGLTLAFLKILLEQEKALNYMRQQKLHACRISFIVPHVLWHILGLISRTETSKERPKVTDLNVPEEIIR